MKKNSALACVGLLTTLVTTANAQTLSDVVVSASRAEQRSFDAPAAIQGLNRDQIETAGPQINLSESLVRVPGLTILERQNYAQDLQVSIRGFGARSAFGIRGIRLLIDGIPATTPDGQGQSSSISLTSTDRIEVLRGPLAQLYGNSSGGVIQAFTKSAPQTPEAGFQYYAGDNGMRRANYQLADTVGKYGLVADYGTFTIDGYRGNSMAERKQFNGKVSFNANDQMRVNVVFNQFDMPIAQDPLGLTRAQLMADPAQAGNGAVRYSARKAVLQNQIGSSMVYTLDPDRSMTARAYYGTRENLQYQAGTTATGTWVGLNRTYYGAGLQYNEKTKWGTTPIEWVAGYEFDRSGEFRQSGLTSAGQKTGQPTRSEDNQSENSDFFAQGTAMVSDNVSVVAGVRQSSVRFASEDYYITSSNPDGSGNAHYRATSPVLGVTLNVTDNLNLYANYGKGFETPTLSEMAYSGTASPVATFNPSLNAATSRHYEVGAKWTPNRQSRIDLSAYQINSTDEIVVAVSSFGQTAFTNAPGTLRTGWEMAGSTLITPHVSVSMSASTIDAQYSQAFQSKVAGVTTKVDSGNKIPGIPLSSVFSELAWTSESTQNSSTGALLGTRLSVSLVQAGRIYANDINTESADGHTVLNLAASHRWRVGQKGTLSLYGRMNNILDERYIGSVIVNQSASQFYEPGLPKNWTLGMGLNLPL
jgi:iron complex outermembrane receptor protein